MTRFKLAVLLALSAAPLQAKPRAQRPEADVLLLKALRGPSTGYVALERVQVFPSAGKPKALKVAVTGLPSGRVRREALPLKKKAPSVIEVRDSEDPTKALARLKNVYAVTVSTGGVVAKRKTWKLELRLRSGLLRRALWVDRDSGLLMKRETYRDDGSLRRRERIVKLGLPAAGALVISETPAAGPWRPDGFAFTGENGGAKRWSNGLESYEVGRVDGKLVVSGDLAEDDAARLLETEGK